MKKLLIFLKWLMLSILSVIGLITIFILCLPDFGMSELRAISHLFTIKEYDYDELYCDTLANKPFYTFHTSKEQLEEILESGSLRDMGVYDASAMNNGSRYLLYQGGQSFSCRTPQGGLKQKNTFVVLLDSIAHAEVNVTIYDQDSKVVVEKRLGYEEIEKRIPSTHILEYSILYYLGKLLNEKNMPLIVFPKELSQKQIVETYQSFNSEKVSPFSDVELFGSEIND